MIANIDENVGKLRGSQPWAGLRIDALGWQFHRTETHIVMPKKRTTRKPKSSSLVPTELVERHILVIRGENVLLDADLAELYEVETKALTRAVRRNIERFPEDFMFQLSPEEFDDLRRHSGTSSQWGGRRYAPYAFTEQGVAMLSSVLRSQRAVDVNVEIMRTFVRLRRMLASNAELSRKLAALETKYDHQFQAVFDAIRQLMQPPRQMPTDGRIGFGREGEK